MAENQEGSSSGNPSNQGNWAIWECEISNELRIKRPWNGWGCNSEKEERATKGKK